MRKRSSIFNSRLFGSALIWAVMAVVLIERHAQIDLPARLASHEVDQMLYDLDHGRIPNGETLFLGDSVGRQIAHAILRGKRDAFVPLASNAAIETPGQYYILQRYLEHHPAPKRVILMMGNPVEGQLNGNYTENYVQRCFLRWREIEELAWARHSLSFGIVMAGYKLFPTFRYRLNLQKAIPLLETPNPYFGWLDMPTQSGTPKLTTKHGLLDVINAWIENRCLSPQIASIYFRRLANFLEVRGIEWVYLPIPAPESASRMVQPDGFYGHQVQCVRDLSRMFPLMKIHDRFLTYPDTWFRDGSHLHEKNLPVVAEEYARILTSLRFP
ncbi:MAG: hypothetical protein WCL16_05405 [bacterium]